MKDRDAFASRSGASRGTANGQRARILRSSRVSTSVVATSAPRPKRTIRQPSLDGAVVPTTRASVEGGVTAGVPVTPSTAPVGDALAGSSLPDGALDGAVDGGFEGGVDGGLDGGFEGGVEGGVDGSLDGGFDGGFDGGVEGGVDGGVDGGVEGGVDGGVEGGVDGGVEGGVESVQFNEFVLLDEIDVCPSEFTAKTQ